MRGKALLVAMAAATLATSAGAQERTGYRQIAAGDFSAARAELEAESRTYPRRPDLMLNLAAVNVRAGRLSEARDLYRSVLARGDTAMDMPNGAVLSSHALAQAGLARLDAVRTASR
jgi:Tfp pilus assembly protein PilF